MKTGEPVESLSLSKILVLYMRKYLFTSTCMAGSLLYCVALHYIEILAMTSAKANFHSFDSFLSRSWSIWFNLSHCELPHKLYSE